MRRPLEPLPWIIVLAVAAACGCGPSVEDDGAAGTMASSDDSSQDGGLLPDPTVTCEPVSSCDELDVTIEGDCSASAFTWNGARCVEVTGCTCTGRDCCHLTATREECLAEVAAGCEGVAACMSCAPGTQCVQYCSHVGTLMTTTCSTCEGGACTCGDVCTGICGGVCMGVHPDAIDCVE